MSTLPAGPLRHASPPDTAAAPDAAELPQEAAPHAAPPDRAAREADRSIGALLVDSGKLTLAQAEKILVMQRELGIRFGEAAVRLKLVSDDDLRYALARQHGYGYLRKEGSRVAKSVRAAFEPYCGQVEAMRVLRSQLMLRWFTGHPERRALAIVSPDPQEGRSFVAANLAVLFAQLGERTLLIDANLRRPVQHQLFGLQDKLGLSTVLAQRSNTVPIEAVSELTNLSLLVAGPTPPNPQELLGREQFGQLLQKAAQNFDVILIDTPDARACADAHTVAVRAGAALMVVRERASRIARIDSLRQNLASVGATVVGTVLNRH